MSSKNPRLNDVAVLPPEKNLELSLEAVGLENVQTQVRFQGALLPARAQANVSLVDKKSRGIHMSRIFRIINHLHEKELDWGSMNAALEQILATHEKLSDAAELEVGFEFPVLRKALLSQEEGWRTYPVRFKISQKQGARRMILQTRVLYSSTCPCSASLSRQMIQEQFRNDFRESQVHSAQVLEWLGQPASIAAVPHAQRSEAVCEFEFDGQHSPPSVIGLIDDIEQALGTPVQAAVKREDEQEFARRNAQNLMFCEDAARKLKSVLLARRELADFRIEVRHFESLHAHDVVAKVSKNT